MAISTEYAGNGKFSCSIALTAGASLEGGVGYSKNIGNKKDGVFSEICLTARWGGSLGACGGANLEKGAKPYATGKVGVRAGSGITANIGYQKTIDFTPGPQYVDRNPHLQGLQLPNALPDLNNVHPNMLQNIRF